MTDDGVVRSAYRWFGALALVLAVGTVSLVLLAKAVSSGAGGHGPAPEPVPVGDEGDIARVVAVVDGDTLRVSVDGTTERLRIIGIDAPELSNDECLAQESASMMQHLVQSKSVRIAADSTQADRDAFDRALRHVWLLDGRSVGVEMLSAGLATEYTFAAPYVGLEDFRAAQEEARAAGRGVWGEVCDGWVAPADPTTPVPTESPAGCGIKGNINAEGERIYHVPGQRFYDDTRIDPADGEQWFCTEQEARDAGWRKARR